VKLDEVLMEVWVKGKNSAGLREKKADGILIFLASIFSFY